MSDEIPIACCLSNQELRERESTLLAQLKAARTGIDEIENGYTMFLPGDRKSLMLVADLIAAERECCPFLVFELMAKPRMGPLILCMTGPLGSKEFLKTILL